MGLGIFRSMSRQFNSDLNLLPKLNLDLIVNVSGQPWRAWEILSFLPE